MLCISGLEEIAWKAILITKEGHRSIFFFYVEERKTNTTLPFLSKTRSLEPVWRLKNWKIGDNSSWKTICVLIVDVQATDHANAETKAAWSANTSIISAYVIKKKGRTASRTKYCWQATPLMHIEEKTLPPITPASIEGEVLWVYLDSGSALYFISSDAVKKLKLVTSRVARDIESERGQSPVHAHLWYQHRLSDLQSDWRNWTHWLSITWFHHCEEARHEPGEKQVLTHARGILKEVLNDDHRRVFDKPYPWSQYL